MPKFLNKILNIKSEYESDSKEDPDSKKKANQKHKKVVVFDLDETLGSFGQFGSFCMLLDDYYNDDNKAYSMFNELMDLYPEYPRPYILNVLRYLLQKKKDEKCKAVMIYTNNQGERTWVEHIKSYFETKLKSKIFEQIISAFKVDGKIVEVNRTTQDKTIDDFFRCTKLPKDIEICFVDDLFHPKMEDDSVYYIHVKGYKHYLPSSVIIKRFLNSNLAKDMKNNNAEKEKFTAFMMNRLNYNIAEKDPDEQEMDVIISKKMLEHMKTFFKEDKNNVPRDDDISINTATTKNIKSKSFKKKRARKNQTMKKN
jgi:hypothetical protein